MLPTLDVSFWWISDLADTIFHDIKQFKKQFLVTSQNMAPEKLNWFYLMLEFSDTKDPPS